jgi:hypothetical protein
MVITFVKQIIRFGIYLMSVFLSLSCASASEEFLIGAVLSDATSPTMNAVVWIEDDNGQKASFWIHGKNYEFGIVAMHSEMVFPIGESLWLWQESDETLPLCDCAVWRLQDFKGDCPPSLEPAARTVIVFTNLDTGEEEKLELGPQIDFGRPDKISEFGSEVELMASVGPYLFIRYGERGHSCIAGESLQTQGFIVFNLETMQVTDILSDSERKSIAKNEQKTAFEIMRGDNLVSVLGPEEMELTAIVPTYHPSYGVALTYQFSKSVTFGGQHSGAYSRQISVPAQTLPKKLVPFLLLPQVVHNFMFNTMDTQFGGWIPISCPVDRMGVLLETFRTSH